MRLVYSTALSFCLAGAASAAGGTFWIFLVILWLPGVALVLALHRSALTTAGDVLTYRVLRRTQAWHRREIKGFWQEASSWTRGMTAHLGMETVTGEQVAFRAIDVSLLVEREVLDGWLDTLQDWLEPASEPVD